MIEDPFYSERLERAEVEKSRVYQEARAKRDAELLAFYEEYEALVHKHQIYIFGCGCCGSPEISHFCSSDDESIKEQIIDHLEHIKPL